MKADDLLAMVDFLYRGEANIFQENLDSFLAIAEELQLKGLMGKTEEKIHNFEEDKQSIPRTFSPDINTHAKIPKSSFNRQIPEIHNPREDQSLAIPSSFSGDIEELEEKVKSMMEKSQNKIAKARGQAQEYIFAHRCKVCGKEGQGPHIKDHIEANHLEGIIIPCNLCDKTFRSRNGLRQHKRQHQN